MKKCSKCKEIKELSEFYKDKSLKNGFKSQCKTCLNYYLAANKEKIKVRIAACYTANKEKYKVSMAVYAKANKEKIRTRQALWYKENSEKVLKRSLLWGRANLHKLNSKNVKRRIKKLQRTPSWLTEKQFKEIDRLYLMSHILTQKTGIKHEVDHIVPLQGENVSGLHVPWNLQILTKSENAEKGNKLIE